MQHRVGGVVEKVAAVEEGYKLYARRQDARVEFVDLFVNPCQSKLGVVALLELDWVTGQVLAADGGVSLWSPIDPAESLGK